MAKSLSKTLSCWSLCLAVMAGCLTCLTVMPVSPAVAEGEEELLPYLRVEEDWELVLRTPDTGSAQPQVTIEMHPDSTGGYFFCFDISQRRVPSFTDGGLQVQIWSGTTCLKNKSYGTALFSTNGETMTWTQCARVTASDENNEKLKFGILSGTSTTWGSLASNDLNVKCVNPALTLNNYNSDLSVNKSSVTAGANRVQSLKLLQVRKYRVDLDSGTTILGDVETIAQTVWDESNLQ